jgi:hypothetical protein
MAEDSLKLYLNGELIGSKEDITDLEIANGLPLMIGLSTKLSAKLDGQLDDLRMYNYALSADEVAAAFAETGIEPHGLVAHWKFDESSFLFASDEMGSSGGTLLNMDGTEWVAGQLGNAIDFAAASDSAYIQVQNNKFVEFDSTESFSISFMVKADPVANTDEQQIVMKGAFGVDEAQGWAGKWYGIQFKSGELRIAVDDNVNKTQLGVKIGDFYPSNEWVHVVGVRDGAEDSLKLYLNGKLIGTKEDATDLDIASGLPLFIGANVKQEKQLDGQLDDLRLYNHALSADDVAELFAETGIVTSLASTTETVPTEYSLMQNYPNPFNPVTTIEFHLKKAGKSELTLFNSLGQKVQTLVNEELPAGVHKVTMQANNLSSGIYFYKIESGSFVQVRKMVLIK